MRKKIKEFWFWLDEQASHLNDRERRAYYQLIIDLIFLMLLCFIGGICYYVYALILEHIKI